MALHRDIFWVGKQWAVTGFGLQAVDQKQKSKFDIEASRLWEDDLLDALSDQRWFDAEDFNAGLTVARAKYPEAPGRAAARKKAAKESARVPVASARPGAKAEKAAVKAEVRPNVIAEPPKPDVRAKAEPRQPATAPAPSKLAIIGGTSKPAINVGAKRDANDRRKVRPAAQVSMRLGGSAKFTLMWRVRFNR